VIKLYLFTFSFVTVLGTYPTMDQCLETAFKIARDYRYDHELIFTLYCRD
tara:strand:- start:86 stop:235 length:150 start_codon:yes stop_codon:yes gene_type:complete